MNKIWFIIIESRQEGPYSLLELKADSRLTPDTLVWKEGFKEWTPIRHVLELKEVFEDKPEDKPASEDPSSIALLPGGLADQETLALRQDPPQFFLWLLAAALIALYAFYLFNRSL